MRILPSALKTEVEGLIEKKTITLDLWDDPLDQDDNDDYDIRMVAADDNADTCDAVKVLLTVIIEGTRSWVSVPGARDLRKPKKQQQDQD